MSIAEFCNRDVVCATLDTTVIQAANLMRDHQVGDLVIVDVEGDRRWPIGIVTDRDIVVDVVAPGRDPHSVKLADLMIHPVVTVEQHAGYAQTVRTMAKNGVRRMPVIDSEGALLGIVTFDDILCHLAVPLADLGMLAGHVRQHGMHKRT